MTKTAYIGIFALLLLMVMVNVLFDMLGNSEPQSPNLRVSAGEQQNENAVTFHTPSVNEPAMFHEPAPVVHLPEPIIEEVVQSQPEPIVLPATATHKVVNGDTCWELAVKYYDDGREWTRIQKANATLVGPRGELQLNSRLTIPGVAGTASASATPVSLVSLTETSPPTPTIQVGGNDKLYKVQHGDTCWVLAKKFYGDATVWRQIRDANPSKVGTHGELRTGQSIVLPGVE